MSVRSQVLVLMNASSRCVILVAAPSKDGPVLLSTFNLFDTPECGFSILWTECAWDIPVEVTYGSPGEFRFTVPKAYASWDGVAPGIENLVGETRWFSANKVIPLWHLAWTVRAPGDHQHDHQGLIEPSGISDVTMVSSEIRTFTPWMEAWPIEPAAPVMSPGKGNLLGAGGIRDYPELDLVRLDMREEGEDLVVKFGMAGLPAMPAYDIQLALLMELSNGLDWELGVMQSNGDSYGYAGQCISFGCHHAFLERTPLEVVDDSYEIRLPLETIGNPAAGTETTWLLAYTMYGEANHDIGPPGQDGSVNLHSGSIIDSHVGGNPFVFQGHGEPVDAGHQH